MKLSIATVALAGVAALAAGPAAYTMVADEATDATVTDVVTETPVVPDDTADDATEDATEDADEPAEEAERAEEGTDETDEAPGGPEAAAEHREAMALWKDCVSAAAAAAPTAEEPVDVLALCGTKPHPPGKATGWDGAQVSKNAQKKVDHAVDKAAKVAEKAAKTNKGKGHQH